MTHRFSRDEKLFYSCLYSIRLYDGDDGEKDFKMEFNSKVAFYVAAFLWCTKKYFYIHNKFPNRRRFYDTLLHVV